MNCEKCGCPVGETDVFCRSCGASLKSPEPVQEETPAYREKPEYQPYYSEKSAEDKPKKNNGYAIASLVCGIISVVLCCVSPIAGVLAIVFGSLARKEERGNTMALAGLILGILSLALTVLSALLLGLNLSMATVL